MNIHARDFPVAASGRPTLADTVALMKWLHESQEDPSGYPYYFHPLRATSNLLRLWPDAPEDVVFAMLFHDTIEDCKTRIAPHLDPKTTPKELYAPFFLERGYSQDCVDIILLLTKDEDDIRPYQEKILALIESNNRGAIVGKLADNLDNRHPERVADLAEKDPKRAARLARKYDRSLPLLTISACIPNETVMDILNNPEPLPIRHVASSGQVAFTHSGQIRGFDFPIV
ncbi:MAG: hypothetical protein AB7E85_04305 [Pseudobdellovibrionaceae bacterium]